MKRRILIIFLLNSLALALAQTVNPATQINWPLVTGVGAPTGSCSATNYGQPYTDVQNNVPYVCTSSGWRAQVSNLAYTINPNLPCAGSIPGAGNASSYGCIYTEHNNLFRSDAPSWVQFQRYMNVDGPGYDLGNIGTFASGWMGAAFEGNSMNHYTRGISNFLKGNYNKNSIGDTNVVNFYTNFYGGAVAASDEGATGNRMYLAQEPSTTGTVGSNASTGSTTLNVSGITPEDGAYLIDKTRGGTPVQVSSFAFDSTANLEYATATSYSGPTSTAWGTIDPSSCYATPYTSGNTIVRSGGVVTFTPGQAVAYNSRYFPVNSTITIAGAVPNDLNGTFTVTQNSASRLTWSQAGSDETSTDGGTARMAAPSGGNGMYQVPVLQTCTVNLGTSSGTFVASSGILNHIMLAGPYMEEVAAVSVGTTSSGTQSITFLSRYAWDSSNGNTIHAAVFQGGPVGQSIVSNTFLGTTSGPGAIQVVGATGGKLYLGMGALGDYRGQAIPGVFPANSSYTMYPSAEINGVCNSTSNNCVNLGTNSVAWTAGDVIMVPLSSALRVTGLKIAVGLRTPSLNNSTIYTGTTGIQVIDSGPVPMTSSVNLLNPYLTTAGGVEDSGIGMLGGYSSFIKTSNRPTLAVLDVGTAGSISGASSTYNLFVDRQCALCSISIDPSTNPVGGTFGFGGKITSSGSFEVRRPTTAMNAALYGTTGGPGGGWLGFNYNGGIVNSSYSGYRLGELGGDPLTLSEISSNGTELQNHFYMTATHGNSNGKFSFVTGTSASGANMLVEFVGSSSATYIDNAGLPEVKDASSNNTVTIQAPTLTAGITATLPNLSGTLALTSQLPLSGTTASWPNGGSTIAPNTCVNGPTVTISGATNAMAVIVSPASNPSATPGLTWSNAYVSNTASGTVQVVICNISATSITPIATSYNVRVIR